MKKTKNSILDASTMVVPAFLTGAAALLLGACGPGSVGEAARPKDPTAASALGEEHGACSSVSRDAEVLVLDWKDEQRADLEIAMKKGVAVVGYDCSGIRLLPDCSVKGGYGFAGFSLKHKETKIDSSDDLQANLPLSVATMSGELKRGSTIDLAYVMVGQKGTTIDAAAKSDLVGKCTGATHIVREAKVGAFAFGTGTKGEANVALTVLGKGGSASSISTKSVTTIDGDVEACQDADENATTPTPRCQALVKLKLGPILAEKPKQRDEASDTSAANAKGIENPCNDGFVQTSDGKCTKKGKANSYLCNPRDLEECVAQCDKGSAESCFNAAALQFNKQVSANQSIAREKANAFFEKGCTGGHAPSCGRLASFLLLNGKNQDTARGQGLLKKGCAGGDDWSCERLGKLADKGFDGAAPSSAQAFVYYQKACGLGSGYSCAMVARAYIDGKGVAKNATEGLRLLTRSCDAGDMSNCRELATHYLDGGDGISRDPKNAKGLLEKSCDGGYKLACDDLGTMYVTGNGVPKSPDKAKALFEKTCPEKWGNSSCVHLGELYEKGDGVTKDKIRALDLYERSCPGPGCAPAASLYERGGDSIQKDTAKAADLYEKACQPSDTSAANKDACSKAGRLVMASKDKAKALYHFGKVCSLWHDEKDCAQFKSLGGTPPPAAKQSMATGTRRSSGS